MNHFNYCWTNCQPTRWGWFAFLYGLVCTNSALSQDVITLYYSDRPPYTERKNDGSVTGLTASPAAEAFRAANIPYVWQMASMIRQLYVLKNPVGLSCNVGLFKTPEREKFSKYTHAIYRDKPFVLIAKAGYAVPPGTRLEALLASKHVRVLLKDHYSYGPKIDGLLHKLKPRMIFTTVETWQMLKMLQADRADFMFAAEEEARFLLERFNRESNEVQLIKIANMPNGEYRYIVCTKLVPDDIIQQLNIGISRSNTAK